MLDANATDNDRLSRKEKNNAKREDDLIHFPARLDDRRRGKKMIEIVEYNLGMFRSQKWKMFSAEKSVDK